MPYPPGPCGCQLQCPPARCAELSLLKNETTLKVGLKNKRLTAGWTRALSKKS
jgi:hypothetical protein